MKTKKNIYIVPSLMVLAIKSNQLLSGSVSSNKDITFGGRDAGGTQTPSSIDIELDDASYDDIY